MFMLVYSLNLLIPSRRNDQFMQPKLVFFLSLISYVLFRDLVFRELFVFVEEARMQDSFQGWKSRVSLYLQLFD